MSKKIILLSGYAGSGKDTVGDILVKDYGYTRFAFADRLKQYVSTKYSINRELMETQEGKRSLVNTEGNSDKTLSVRDILIDEAAKSKRDYPNVWADFLLDDISDSECDKIVVTDLRYPNEYSTIKKYYDDVTACRIHNPNIEILSDDSEHQMDSFTFDKVIYNTSDLSFLRESVKKLNL